MPANANGLQALRGLRDIGTGRADRRPTSGRPDAGLTPSRIPTKSRNGDSDQVGEVPPSCGGMPQQFHLGYFGVTTNRGLAVLDETEIEAVDQSAAILAVAEIPWPAWAVGLRVVDEKGHPIFERLKSDWQLPWRD